MGLLTGILTLPLAPVRGTFWVIDQVMTAAEQEYYDPEPVRRQLAELERALADGRILEEEYERGEDELLDRLEEIEHHQRKGGGNP